MIERPVFTSNPFLNETRFGVVWALVVPVTDFDKEVREVMGLPYEGAAVEVHMREAVRGNGENGNKYAGVLGVIRESFGFVASELDRWGIEAHSVVAITSEMPAGSSKRFGFMVQEVSQKNVDEDRIERAWAGYQLTSRYDPDRDAKEKMRIFVCYQPFNKFMRKFGGRADSIPEEVSS